MPSRLFNAVCDECELFKPRCAWVFPKGTTLVKTWCQDCRCKKSRQFVYHDQHTRPVKVVTNG